MDPITLTAMSLQVDMQKINVIANNAANALTPGFKRELVAVAGVLDGQMLGNASDLSGLGNLPQLRVLADNAPGVPRQTSNPLDLAILGEGYFEVQTPNGAAYTRQGTFHLDAQGRLVTPGGFAVAGVGGDIVLNTANPSIDRMGKIFDQGGNLVAQVKVVTFDGPSALKNIGGGLLVTPASAQPRDVEQPRVAQGQLESSNVDSNREMVHLLETYRHFESASRVLQAYDDMRDKTFRALGQF